MSFIMILFTNFESVICCHCCHNSFKTVKELHKVSSTILIYTSIGKFTITITYTQRTPDIRAISVVRRLWWDRY